MERFNYFSVLLYVLLYIGVRKTGPKTAYVLTAMIEFILHASLAIIYIGWYVGFSQFMLVIIPIPFYLDFKRKITPFVLSLIDFSIYISLKIIINDSMGLYNVTDNDDILTLYILNSVFSFIVIIYISAIYIFSKARTQTELREANELLHQQAMIDPLTSLFNRRAMMDFLKLMEKNSKNSNTTYVIGLGDIDDFKAVNDTYGHDMGDVVLIEIAKSMLSAVPSEGYVCRWGGEEILFAIPSSVLADGKIIADKICNEVKSKEYNCNGKAFSVSITIGLAEVDRNITYEAGIKTADKNLYLGKQSGKNKVVSRLTEVK